MLITENYRELNKQLHASRPDYGTSINQWIAYIQPILTPGDTVINYGCGKCILQLSEDCHTVNYDPAIKEYSELPEPADIVICTDVLGHVEPECLDDVLTHLRMLTLKFAFLTIELTPAKKFLADGRNAHLNLHPSAWWIRKLMDYFTLNNFERKFEKKGFPDVRNEAILLVFLEPLGPL